MCQSALLAALITAVSAAPTVRPLLERSETRFSIRSVEAVADSAPLTVSDHVLQLKSSSKKAPSSEALHSVLNVGRTSVVPSAGGAAYNIEIDFGGNTFSVIFDTGSSDLWLAEEGVQCLNITGAPLPESFCSFGPLAPGTFQDGNIANENFNITYGDGSGVVGKLGYEDVTIAGITVKHQESALINEAFEFQAGDNKTSGLIGFAFPSLTSAFAGTNPAVDNPNTTLIPYTNWIFNAIDQGLIPASFSLALERNNGTSQLALGGLPSIPFTQDFVSTPLDIIDLIHLPSTATNYSFYTITPDGFSLKGEEETWWGYDEVNENPSTNFPAIVDSGTTLVYLPTQVAEAIAATFDPPAVYVEEEGVYENDCDATAPTFAIRIAGRDFYINAQDLLLQGELGYDPNTGGCILGIQPSPAPGPYILGDVFLKNVVAVFDIGAKEMRFAAHENY